MPTETPVKPLLPWLTVRRNVESGLELKGTQEIVVDIPRPRGADVLTAPRFVALKTPSAWR